MIGLGELEKGLNVAANGSMTTSIWLATSDVFLPPKRIPLLLSRAYDHQAEVILPTHAAHIEPILLPRKREATE